MSEHTCTSKKYGDVLKNVRTFIELSLHEEEKVWSEWISSTTKSITPGCWKKKQCHEKNCPAYENECGRCWLIAGTMCGCAVQGKFAVKYISCYNCEVFQGAVFKDAESELQEHILILIHSLRAKQLELQEAMQEIKKLSGLLPICMTCKKIRDDKGYWNQLESYITEHSDVNFSHGICPECIKEHYPELYEKHYDPDLTQQEK